MRNFINNWKHNFKNSWSLSLLVIMAVNAGSLILEDGMSELELVVQQYGFYSMILLLLFSIALNALLLALIASFIYTLIDALKKNKN